MRIVLAAISLMILTSAVGKDHEVETVMTVASEKVKCVGVGQTECLVVRYGDSASWELFAGEIEGFRFEPGYECILKVRKVYLDNPPADAPAVKTMLVEKLSMQARKSDIPFSRCRCE